MVGFTVNQLQIMELEAVVAIAKSDAAGSSRAMNEVVRRFEKRADYFANTLCFVNDDRADVKNAALMAVVAAVRAHDPARGGLKTYIGMTMEGAARRVSKRLGDEWGSAPAKPFDAAVDRDSIREPRPIDNIDIVVYGDLTPAVEALQPRQLRLVERHFIDGLGPKEIADEEGTTTSAVTQRIHTVVNHLRRSLDNVA